MAPRFCGMSAPCQFYFRPPKWLPVLFIMTVVVWSYYAYVLQLNLCFYSAAYHFLLTMFLWAHWQTIFTDIGTVPKQFRLPPSELDRYEAGKTEEALREVLERFTQKQNLPIYNRTIMGESFRAPIFRLNHSWVQDKDGFSLGAFNNFVEVFGEDRSKWFLPVATRVLDFA